MLDNQELTTSRAYFSSLHVLQPTNRGKSDDICGERGHHRKGDIASGGEK